MAVDPVDSVVGTHRCPQAVRSLTSLPRIDYADLFTLSTDVRATPEQWARAMFGDVPDATGWFIWRGLLGLQLVRWSSPDTVAGWQIAGRGEDWIRLEAASWFLTGNLVVRTADGRVSLGTFMHLHRRLGRWVWTPLSAIHRKLAPRLLRNTASTVRASTPRVLDAP